MLTFYRNKAFKHLDRLEVFCKGGEISPVTLDVDLTDKCNCACPECSGGRGHSVMDVSALYELLGQARKEKVKSIVYTGGGEPTLHPYIADILHATKDRGFSVALVTNGIQLAKSGNLREAVLYTCDWLRISLDAGDREMYKVTHGVDQFDAVVKGMKELAWARNGRKPTIGAAFLTSKETEGGIWNACISVKKAGIDYLYLRPYMGDKYPIAVEKYSDSFSDAHFEVIAATAYRRLNETEKHYPVCHFGWWVSVVRANGDVVWCCRFRQKPKYNLGNIHEVSLPEILAKRAEIEINMADCDLFCRGDEMNHFLHEAIQPVMHEVFL